MRECVHSARRLCVRACVGGWEQEALQAEPNQTYLDSLTGSMAMVLDEFYEHLEAVGVSAMTGEGAAELFAAIDRAGEEYKRSGVNNRPAHRQHSPTTQSARDSGLWLPYPRCCR